MTPSARSRRLAAPPAWRHWLWLLALIPFTVGVVSLAAAIRAVLSPAQARADSAASTRRRVASATSGRWLRTFEAVAVETPAARATMLSVARCDGRASGVLMAATLSAAKRFRCVSMYLGPAS